MAYPGWETPSHGDGDLPFLPRLRGEDRGNARAGPAKKAYGSRDKRPVPRN